MAARVAKYHREQQEKQLQPLSKGLRALVAFYDALELSCTMRQRHGMLATFEELSSALEQQVARRFGRSELAQLKHLMPQVGLAHALITSDYIYLRTKKG